MDQRISISFDVATKIKCFDALEILAVLFGESTFSNKIFINDKSTSQKEQKMLMSTTDKNIEIVQKSVMKDRRISIEEVVGDIAISVSS